MRERIEEGPEWDKMVEIWKGEREPGWILYKGKQWKVYRDNERVIFISDEDGDKVSGYYESYTI